MVAEGAAVVLQILSGGLFLGILTGAITLIGRWLVASIAKELALRSVSQIRMIKLCHKLSHWAIGHPRLSGKWVISWSVTSKTFQPESKIEGELYSIFGKVFIQGVGIRKNRSKLPYAFVGEFNQGRKYITGNWFDLVDRTGGYSGSFQIEVARSQDTATGLWLGFSEKDGIKSGSLKWEKLTNPD